MIFFKAPRYVLRKLNILRIIENLNFETFIDIGCGAGDLTLSIASRGKKGIGMDFSINAIKTANNLKKKYLLEKGTVKFELRDALESKAEKFDLVICCEMLEHINDDKEVMKILAKKSYRYILISVPAKRRLFDSSDKAVGHFRRYEKIDIYNLLESNNLSVLKFINYGFPLTNIVRIIRKFLFVLKYKMRKNKKPEDLSKESGINPIKLPGIFSRINTEKILLPFYWISILFNNTDLGEGYLVLCEKNTSLSNKN